MNTVVDYVRRGHSQPGVISINYSGNIWPHTRYKCLGLLVNNLLVYHLFLFCDDKLIHQIQL